MNRRNRIKSLLPLAIVAMALILAASPVSAELVLEEQFTYGAGNIDGRDGGIGFDGAWNESRSHGQIYSTGIKTFAGGDGTTINEDTGLYFLNVPVAGSALSRFGNAGRAQAHRLLSSESQAALTADDTTIWFGVLISVDKNYQNMMFGFGTEKIGHSPAFQLADADGELVAGDGFGVSNASGTGMISAFVFDNSDLATFVDSAFTPALQDGATHHDTALIVGKINWKAAGTPDEFFLFNITDANTVPDEIDAIVSITDRDLDQSAFDTITAYDGTVAIIDEIRFATTFAEAVKGDLTAPAVDAGSNWITWSGAPVALDDVVIVNNSEPQTALTYAWTAEPNGIDDPDLDVVFSATDVEAPTVTITKAAGDAVTVTLIVAVNNVGGSKADRNGVMKIDIYDDTCLAAAAAAADPLEFDLTDLDENCITNLGDFAEMAVTWMVDYSSTGPVVKP